MSSLNFSSIEYLYVPSVVPKLIKLNSNFSNVIFTLVDAPLLLDEGFGLEEVSLTTLLELGTKAKR
jgi:hypothetical protein